MGTAWHAQKSNPWEEAPVPTSSSSSQPSSSSHFRPLYTQGIETIKVNIMLRIYANKWHVYAGLAILNPHARIQIDQYAASATALFKIMLEGRREVLRKRVHWARDKVFPPSHDGKRILLSESMLDQFSLSSRSASAPGFATSTSTKQTEPPANSHLSILAMVDSWAHLDIQPFAHLALAATPIFRIWIGVAEALFRNADRLERAIDAAVLIPPPSSQDNMTPGPTHRSDDLEFVIAARGWSKCVSFGSFKLYEERFGETRRFFEGRFAEADKVGGAMIKMILQEGGKQ